MTTKLNCLIFSLSVLMGVTVRTFMLAFTVERESGFIKAEYMTTAVFIIVFLLIAAALVFFCALTYKSGGERLPVLNNKVYGAAAALMAGAILYETFFSPLLQYATNLQSVLHTATTLASAASLIYIAFCRFTYREYPKVITIAPIVFWITRIITVFTEFATLATVSDTVIETACMCLSLLTFLYFAKIECNQPVKNRRLCLAMAVLCSYVCTVGSLPRLICQMLNPSAFGYFQNIPALTALVSAVFSAVFAYSLLNKES